MNKKFLLMGVAVFLIFTAVNIVAIINANNRKAADSTTVIGGADGPTTIVVK